MSFTDYLERANYCADLAEKKSDAEKSRLLELADAWLKMAEDEVAKTTYPITATWLTILTRRKVGEGAGRGDLGEAARLMRVELQSPKRRRAAPVVGHYGTVARRRPERSPTQAAKRTSPGEIPRLDHR